jgi:putative Holliday junction resolvase
MSTSPGAPGRIAGIDYGTRRIGIAMTDSRRTLASPYETYTRQGADADARRFQRLVAEEGVGLFVVGLPVHASGQESQKSREARRFGRWLQQVTGVPVVFFDERYTTSEAEAHLTAAGLTAKRRQRRLDMLAAQIMLSAYLQASAKGRAEPGPLDDRSPEDRC